MTLQGKRASAGIHTGLARFISKPSQVDELQPGEIMLTKMTTPDWIECFEKIKANGGGIITTTGGMTCHAAIVCREYGIPCVVGLHGALVLDGRTLKMNGLTGEVEVLDA